MSIFLSHAHIDDDVATEIGSSVTETYDGLLTVFRSSDEGESIPLGERIRDSVHKSLSSCVAAISLLSHASTNRPWINIEFGAAWILRVPLIPVCFPDLKPDHLPAHFAENRACSLGKETDCVLLVKRLHAFARKRYPLRAREWRSRAINAALCEA